MSRPSQAHPRVTSGDRPIGPYRGMMDQGGGGDTSVTLGGASGGMPSARSRLFGRDEEIAQVRHLLEDGARLVTITGAGGIGKTRIAVEVCRKVSGKVSFVELSGTDEAGLPGALVRALVPEPGTGQEPG